MDIFEFSKYVIETQGLIGFLVLVSIWQNNRMSGALLAKNCKMEDFLQQCIKRDWEVDHPGCKWEDK